MHLALVPKIHGLSFSEVARVSAAVQKQITRDFAPIWNVEATIDAFPTATDVPVGYWHIWIVDTFDEGGQHRVLSEQPFGLVAYGNSWSLAASHEALEMLADPFGMRVIAGDSPVAGQGRVEFLVEVCDPCQAAKTAYTVNGELVSDFCTQSYYDPVGAPGTRYSYSGKITRPHQVLKGGYLSWRLPVTTEWFQENRMHGSAKYPNLGTTPPTGMTLRAFIDSQSHSRVALSNQKTTDLSMRRAAKVKAAAYAASRARAEQIASGFRPQRRSHRR